jgi:hypothetical protein
MKLSIVILFLVSTRMLLGVDFYAGDFHIGSPYSKLGIKCEHVEAAGFTKAVEAWVPQGGIIHLVPQEAGEVFLTKIIQSRMPVDELTELASRSVAVEGGEAVSIGTEGLETGTYFLSLIHNGVVRASLRLHLAFTELPVSPDYSVSVVRDGKTQSLPSYYTYRRDDYMRYNSNLEGTHVSHGGPVAAHSWSSISTDGYPVTVRLKVLPGAQAITLPLTSAKVLPSSYEIPCSVENGDTIVFTMDRPEKVVVIANHTKAWDVYEQQARGHEPLQHWDADLQKEMRRPSFRAENPAALLSEGYVNPFVFLARSADNDVPDLDGPDTLVVYPGDQPTQEELDEADTVWFKPGPHDFSRLGEWTIFHTIINSGQTFYLEEGAWLLARIAEFSTSDRRGGRIIGRGTISGVNHFWGGGGFPAGSQIIEVDEIRGVNLVDRAYFGIEGGRLIEDIAMLGSWHGNNDGVDSMDNCTIRNSLLISHDDNLKLNHNTHAEHLVLLMLGVNAHAIMVKEILTGRVFSHSLVEDIDIIGYWKNPRRTDSGWHALTPGAIAAVTGSDLLIENFTYRNIRIESPFLYRVFSFYNMDTNQDYAADWFWYPTNDEVHTRINGLTFENISVSSPLIAGRSILGSAYPDSFHNVTFEDLFINGVKVTESNKDTYFEVDEGMVTDLEFTSTE